MLRKLLFMVWAFAAPLLAAQETDLAAFKRLHEGYTLIVGDFPTLADAHTLSDAIRARGGRIDQVIDRRALLGSVPAELDAEIRRNPHVRFLTRRAVPRHEVPFNEHAAVAGPLAFFNSIVDGSRYRELERLGPHRAPENDVLFAFDDIAALSPPIGQQTTYTNQAMSGRIGVAAHFVESNGQSDPNEFTWTAADRNAIATRVSEGINWWVSKARARGITIEYTIMFYYAPGNPQELQPYEPIRHRFREHHLWVSAVMGNWGYTQTHTDPEIQMIRRVTAFNEWFRSAIGGSGAHSIFIIYNPSPAPATHPDGSYTKTYFGGPAILHPFRPGDYPTSMWGLVYAHEMGHIYWACDEYASGCSGCNYCFPGLGPRPTASNGNCAEACNATPESCIMRVVSANSGLCEHTKKQIGW